jgi:O-antigen/teichoic acid export membrane protein
MAMTQRAMGQVDGLTIAKSSTLNLFGQGLPLLLGIWILPFLLRSLGPERFALLSYTLILYGNMSLFELGLGRALTKRTAECLSTGRIDEVLASLWTCAALQIGLGILTGALLASTCTLWLAFLTRDSMTLFQEAKLTVWVVAAFLPFALPSLALRGTLESLQRFDLVNLVRAPQLCALFLFPAAACLFHGGLVWAVAALCSSWVLASLAYLVIVSRVLPKPKDRPRICKTTACELLGFGGWVSVSSALTPLFTHFERFALGFFGSLTVVSMYVLPADALQRLSVMPQSISSTLFPAFTALEASGQKSTRASLYALSVKALLALIGMPVLFFILYAHEILRLWLGNGFPDAATTAGQIIALSVLLNCLTWIPLSLLHGMGRPDLTAKLHLLEALPYMLVCVVLVVRFGVIGAAVGVLIRVTVDAALQFWSVQRLGLSSLQATETGAVLCLIGIFIFVIPLTSSPAWTLYYSICIVVACCLVFWQLVLTDPERATVIRGIRGVVRGENPVRSLV